MALKLTQITLAYYLLVNFEQTLVLLFTHSCGPIFFTTSHVSIMNGLDALIIHFRAYIYGSPHWTSHQPL